MYACVCICKCGELCGESPYLLYNIEYIHIRCMNGGRIGYSTYLLNCHRANVVARYGKMMYNENTCPPLLYASEVHSIKLNVAIDKAIMTDWPASSPLIPARILIAFVQNTANIPM